MNRLSRNLPFGLSGTPRAPLQLRSDQSESISEAEKIIAGEETARHVTIALIVALALVVLYALQPDGRPFWSVLAGGLLLAVGSFVAGGLVGFVFGLPRLVRGNGSSQAGQAAGIQGYAANTALEDISDWLTKIVVGVTLTQLGSIPSLVQGLVAFVQPMLGTADGAGPVALLLMVTYSFGGFWVAYVWVRLTFGWELHKVQELLIATGIKAASVDRRGDTGEDVETTALPPTQPDEHPLPRPDQPLP